MTRSASAPAYDPQTDLQLTPSERRAWEQDGFFARRSVFDPDEVAALGEAAELVARRAEAVAGEGREYQIDGNRYVDTEISTVQFEHRPGSDTIRVIEPFAHFDARFEALLDDPRLVVPMRDLVGTERVSLWTDKLNLKRPREGSRFRWHQDSPYWTHACGHVDQLPNVMLALDAADEANGCLRVVRGSHRRGVLPGQEGDGTTLGPLFTHPDHFDAAEQVPAILPAGSLLFFSPHTVHGSEPNHSAAARRALVLTYQPGDQPMFKREGVRNTG
ncbi:MAG: phytanoyl-CoA dioxygenase family protein [Proteobacteria bacterium]|nr:phytanoyl-CoA dioxygenase family protein [Pseudomonadota bacterium]